MGKSAAAVKKSRASGIRLTQARNGVNVTVSPLESGKIAYGGYVAVSADGKRFFWAPETTAASTIPTIRARPGQRAMVE